MTFEEELLATLVESRPLGGEARHYVLEVPGEGRFAFTPGQHIRLTTTFDGRSEDRYYSIASAPDGSGRFELCLATGSDPIGRFLAAATPGTQFPCSQPGGKFALRPSPRRSFFIGHGTGVSPLRSMIEHLAAAPDVSTTLLLGARTPDSLFFADRFERLQAARENFRFLPTLTRPDAAWEGLRGRVQEHLETVLAETGTDCDVYLCGSREMVQDVCERLLAAGVDEEAVIFEQY